MSTRECLVTRQLHHVEAFSLSTNISESWLHTWGGLGQLLLAEPAECSVVLITCLSDMVWLRVTLGAEVLLATIAPDSVVGHVLCSLGRDRVSFIIFLALDHVSRLHHHDVSAGATYHVRVLFYYLHLLIFVNCVLLLLV